MKVVIIDDEPLARKAIRILVETDPELTIVGEGSGVDAAGIIDREKPDILFLDIQMPEVDGFEVIARIGLHAVPAIVFVTAYGKYALRAFEVDARDYLLKPFNDRRFYAALLRAKERARSKESTGWVRRLLVPARDKLLAIRTQDIDWVEAADSYVSLHVGGRSHLLRQTMAEIEKQLDPERFVRVHRSAIVNVERVREMRPALRGDSTVVLVDGTSLRISRSRREEFERVLTRRR